MSVTLLFDAHVDHAIAGQLRMRDVDVLTAQHANVDWYTDESLLDHAAMLGRVLFTHDIRFRAMAERWQLQNRSFYGLVFAHPMQVSIGQCVRDLEIIAKGTNPEDWVSAILRLPL
jgi:hypothetical protein